jgi:hypothetical protein
MPAYRDAESGWLARHQSARETDVKDVIFRPSDFRSNLDFRDGMLTLGPNI